MEELTTAESMVMKTIWDHPHEMALQEIMKLTNETYGKDWKSQTVSTYIAKLVKKGFLRMNQSGRNATYEIIIPELSYQQEQSRKFVKFWNRGSVAQFLTAFYTWGCLLHLQAVLHLRYMQLLQAFWMG